MKHVPKYLLPRIAPVPGADGEATGNSNQATGFVPFKKNGSRGQNRGRGRGARGRGGAGRGSKKKSDPLKMFGR